jgi:hypothetical protein
VDRRRPSWSDSRRRHGTGEPKRETHTDGGWDTGGTGLAQGGWDARLRASFIDTARYRDMPVHEVMQDVAGDLSSVGRMEVLAAFEKVRGDGSFDRLAQKVRMGLEGRGHMELLQGLARQEAETQLSKAAEHMDASIEFKALLKLLRTGVSGSNVPDRINRAIDEVMSSADFTQLLEAERVKLEPPTEKEGAAAQRREDDSSSEEDSDESSSDDDSSDDEVDDHRQGARVKGQQHIGSENLAVGGAAIQQSSAEPAVKSESDAGLITGAETSMAAPQIDNSMTTLAVPSGGNGTAGGLDHGTLVEIWDALDDEWRRARVIARKGAGSEYIVQYVGEADTSSELLLPKDDDSWRLPAVDYHDTRAHITVPEPFPAAAGSPPSATAPMVDGTVNRAGQTQPNGGEASNSTENSAPHLGKGHFPTEPPVADACNKHKSPQASTGSEQLQPKKGNAEVARKAQRVAGAADTAKAPGPMAPSPLSAHAIVPAGSAEGEWRTSGDAWIGKKLMRIFDGVEYVGHITHWAPPLEEDPPLWRLQHEDGDIEDLERYEVLAGAKALAQRRPAAALQNATLAQDKRMREMESSDDDVAVGSLRKKRSSTR